MPASDPAPAREWRDWASLGTGPAVVIAERVLSNDYVDLLRFSTACRAWRECSACITPHGALDRRFLPRRWIMLPRRIASDDDIQRWWFLDVASGGRIRLRLPDLRHRRHVLGRTAEGLLLLCRKDTYAVQLLNPLTGQVADFPDATTLLGLMRGWSLDMALRNFKLLGAGLVDGSTVMLHFGFGFRSLVIAKPGDGGWTRLEFRDPVFAALPFAGRIYCVTAKNISVVETVEGLPPELVVAVDDNLDPSVCMLDRTCLLNDGGELVLAYRAWSTYDYEPRKYRMYRVKSGARKLVPLARLDGKAFFSGNSRSLLVSSGVSQSVAADTMYVCYERAGQAKALAVGLHGGFIELEHSFDKEDAAGYLSSYVCASHSQDYVR